MYLGRLDGKDDWDRFANGYKGRDVWYLAWWAMLNHTFPEAVNMCSDFVVDSG